MRRQDIQHRVAKIMYSFMLPWSAPAVFLAAAPAAAAAQPPGGVPSAEHIIVVVMENRFIQEVWNEPYTQSLIASGSLCAASYGITHPSQPNYLALWSGSTQGVTANTCPAPGSPFFGPNLGQACEAAGVSWRAYVEDLPFPGYPGCLSADSLYVRKHAPWTNFGNLNHQRERPLQDLATDIAGGTLPRLAFVIPNQCNNTHDCPVSTGDAWLAAHVPALVDAAGPAGFVILTWDEDDGYHANHILTVFAGGPVKGGFVTHQLITHYTVLRTICDALELVPFGAAVNEIPITDVWVPSAAAEAFPDRIFLGPAHPNPSSGDFVVRAGVEPDADVRAAVLDTSGRQVARLLRSTDSGSTILRWDGRWSDGHPAASGVYFLRVSAGSRQARDTLVLIR